MSEATPLIHAVLDAAEADILAVLRQRAPEIEALVNKDDASGEALLALATVSTSCLAQWFAGRTRHPDEAAVPFFNACMSEAMQGARRGYAKGLDDRETRQ